VQTGERRGKEAAQQLAIGMASGEILVFSDVATALAADAVSTIVANFSDPTVGCVSSTDCFVDETGRASGESAYVRYEMWLRSLETRVSTLVGLSGSFFAARREVCRNWATDRPSDFQAVLTAVSMGLRCVIDPRSAGFYQDLADPTREFNRKIRTVVRGLAVLAASPRMLNPFRYGLFAWQLASHKVCRWLVPFAMIAALAANSVLAWSSGFYGATLTGQIGFYLCAVAGSHSRRRYVRLPFYLCQANLAILVAWLRFARGDRIVAWRPSDRAGASRAADIGWPAHLAVRAQKEPQP
jgi:hypothetical protein